MTAERERWARLERLFAEALALAPAERPAFLRSSCADDVGLAHEVEGLLHAHDVPGILDTTPHAAEAVSAHPSLAPGTCLGAWRIDTMIGRGGMGEVYAATRIDAAFEQRAALKLLRYEAAGQLERFHTERRILAKLEHPGIARLLDGGIAADGRPYTVMEYVEGQSITDYCRTHHSNVRERLALFAQVCDAVGFAHRNLVIHRDLKPDNIFVNAEGGVKLLDFGIAKLLDAAAMQGDADNTIAPFTPDYAAPEQLSGEPVTTATDIYALGVLLFELLTGERPLRTRGLPSTHAMKLILDRSAPAPSRIAQASAAPPLPARLLKGDLDAIVAKCLRKQASHRYETVNGLKRDLDAHLRNEPVLAREGARAYVFGRVLRRYRWAVAGVCAVILALAAGLAGTIWQARRAETQARTSAAVQGFLSDLFRSNARHQDDSVRTRQTTAREMLELGVKKIDTAMVDAPAAKLSVLQLLSLLYDDLALDDEATNLRRKVVALARDLHGENSIETADALIELSASMHSPGAFDERGKLLEEAAAILDRKQDFTSDTRGALLKRLADHHHNDVPRALDFARQAVRVLEAKPPSGSLAESLYSRGMSEARFGLMPAAATSYARAIAVSRQVDGFPNPVLPRYYAMLSEVEYEMHDIVAAESSARLALQTAMSISADNHADKLQTEMRLGRILFDSGRTAEGLVLLDAAKQRALRIRGADDPFHTPGTLREHGNALARAGWLQEGLVDMQAAVASRRANLPNSLYLATMLDDTASALIETGRLDEALRYLDEATGIRTRGGLQPHTGPHNANTSARIQLALSAGSLQKAEKLLDELFVDAGHSTGISFTAIEHSLLSAEVDLVAGRSTSAAEIATRVRTRIEASEIAEYLPFYLIRADLIEGHAALLNGRPADALQLLQRTLAMREKMLAPSSPRIGEAQIVLAECHLALANAEQARELASAASAIQAMHPALGEHYVRPLRRLQALLESARKK